MRLMASATMVVMGQSILVIATKEKIAAIVDRVGVRRRHLSTGFYLTLLACLVL